MYCLHFVRFWYNITLTIITKTYQNLTKCITAKSYRKIKTNSLSAGEHWNVGFKLKSHIQWSVKTHHRRCSPDCRIWRSMWLVRFSPMDSAADARCLSTPGRSSRSATWRDGRAETEDLNLDMILKIRYTGTC